MENGRTLTDADIIAIANAISKNMSEKFYNDLGKGVWSLIWRGIIIVCLSIASYGAMKGFK